MLNYFMYYTLYIYWRLTNIEYIHVYIYIYLSHATHWRSQITYVKDSSVFIRLLGIPGFPPGMPYGFVRIFFFFFRRQGFRMITFDRQARPLQNFNRSHIMVIGRSVLFPTPRDPRVGAWGAPNTPNPPPRKKTQKSFAPPPPPGPQEHFLAKLFFFSYKFHLPPPPHLHAPLSPQNTHPNPRAIINNPNNCSMTYRL